MAVRRWGEWRLEEEQNSTARGMSGSGRVRLPRLASTQKRPKALEEGRGTGARGGTWIAGKALCGKLDNQG